MASFHSHNRCSVGSQFFSTPVARLARSRREAFAPGVIRRFFFLLALALAPAVQAADIQPEILPSPTSKVTYDDATGEAIISGDARILYGSALLTADEIRYNARTGIALARGKAVLTDGPRRVLADVITFRLADRSFTVEHARFGEYPLYAEAASASGTKDEITLNHASVTFREPGPWQPSVSAGKIIYAPGQRLRAESAQVGVGGVRPIPFPKFQQSLNESLLAYLSASAGFRSSLGAFGEIGLRVPLAPGLRLGGDFGFYTERGVMFGPGGRYDSETPGRDYHGRFRSGFINDHGDKLVDVLNRPVGENRAYVEWEHRQHLGESLTLTGQVNYWKDSAILRDFRPDAFFHVQEPDTFLESVYSAPNYFLSAFVRYQANSFQTVQERLPEIRFDLLPFAVGNGFYQRFNASAVHLREDPPLGGPELRSDRFDAYYALTRPFAPQEWLSFTPVVGGRVTHYANTRGAARDGGYTRLLGEFGFDAMLRASGNFDYQNRRWKIDGLRHLVTPRVNYRYMPGAERGRAWIPRIDRRQAFTTYLPILGLDATRNLDDLGPTNVLRLGIDNTLQTRDAKYGSRDLLVFNAAADLRFKRDRGVRDVSDIHSELVLTPTNWLQLDLYQSFSVQNFTLRELNSGITLRDGNFWSLRFANNYLRHQVEDYLIEGRVRLNEIFDAQARLHYDARRSRFNQQSYGVVQNLDNTWRISYVVTLYSGRQRESSFGFNVQVEALGF